MVHLNPDSDTKSEPHLDAGARLRVLTIVDRPRHGLAELSYAFACHAKNAGHDATLLHAVHDPGIPSEPWSFGNLWRRAREADVVVVWSYGRTALLLPLLLWMSRTTHWSFVFHEPGGLRAKLRKGDAWGRAVVSALLEAMACRWSHTMIVPRSDRLSLVNARNVVFAPLLYFEDAADEDDKVRNSILYVGRRDPRRKASLFANEAFRAAVRATVPDAAFEFFPPDPARPGTMGQKWEAWRRARAALNFYTIPYNQSGVTVEALLHGVPVLVSDFDPYADSLAALGLALPATADDDAIANALGAAADRQRALAPALHELGSRLGGRRAYETHWAPWLQRLRAAPRRSVERVPPEAASSR
jgi:hypothetical protein